MPLIYEPNYLIQDGIQLHEIVFMKSPEADSVTIFGACRQPETGKVLNRDFGCDFAIFTDLLMLAGDAGFAVIDQIAALLGDDSVEPEEPVGVDVFNLLGGPLVINGISLKIYKPKVQDENGGWEEANDPYYLVDSFKKLAQKELLTQQLTWHFADLQQSLILAFKQYRQLRKLYFSKKEARKKAGLKDELLFQLAKARYKLFRTKTADR